ncbi:bifunctional 2-polyprenyl-6-hydroxyphenol methylase/3-demethylubiquinol 3-O-methyltransferase UbiG [Streptomyces sp. NBC_00893]|uniref:class I SAM-dependent methyltransferase n=1 Tax=Streptomyces sp. NBC_00893 TaxID=2975862 RepID=UPI00224FD377|nr:class I SAM-dependent methyltransferase [Streptomyces sp. NBC_00893]MCX4849621.1 class I SAM-dependent methyltransferase [Streptomyces sp. NBC_00893]
MTGRRQGSPAGTAGYAEAAAALVEQYESVPFADVHREMLDLFPTGPSTILDIGAGSGRDAAALAGLGHRVIAVEPTAELRSLGRRIHADRAIEWIDDSLPELRVLRGRDERFDLILLTAVWMHLDSRGRESGMESIAGLLAPGGQVFLSLRHGPVPAGRRMFDVPPDETTALARHHGLDPVRLSEREDLHGRPGVRWSCLGLRRNADIG